MVRWVRPIAPDATGPVDVLGAKAAGLAVLRGLGLPVPPAFVIGADACRAYRRDGRLPDDLRRELAAAVADLEAATGRRLGGGPRPLAVSVRSGAAVSMPGMMSTVLGVGLTAAAVDALAAESGDVRFARDSRLRFLRSLAAALGAPGAGRDPDDPARAVREVERRTGRPVPDDPVAQLELAVAAVFDSWDAPRARAYRTLHDVPHDLGTAVVVQAMVFGNRDGRSGAGVAFSRDPGTGGPGPFGEVLFGGQGDDVVSGAALTRPLAELRDREPGAWADLRRALARVEEHHRDAGHVEFTVESGALWLLQVRTGGFTGAAAVRLAVDLVDEGVIGRRDALRRVSAADLRRARTPRIAADGADVVARGLGACPGVAVGRVVTSADAAVRLAASGPVVLVRPATSPADVHGIAAAAGVLTTRGGPTSHAAVVARAMGRPAVVGVADLVVDGASAAVGGRVLAEGALVTIDGTSGQVALGRAPVLPPSGGPHLPRLLAWADEVAGGPAGRSEAERLAAAQAVLGRPA